MPFPKYEVSQAVLVPSLVVLFMPVLTTGSNASECNSPIVRMEHDGASHYHVPDDLESAKLTGRYGTPPDSNHVLVIDQSDGEGYWITRDRIGEAALVMNSHADRYTYSGPDHCVPNDLPIDLELEPEADPSELSEKSVQGIQPKSGKWALEMGQPVVKECPQMMRGAMGKPLTSSLSDNPGPQNLTITEPFHPDQLQMTKKMSVTWRTLGPNSWEAEALSEIFSQLPQNAGAGSKLIWQLKVLASDRIRHTATIQVAIPPEVAAALGGTHCTVVNVSHWQRIGD